jgi:hypothetical protein
MEIQIKEKGYYKFVDIEAFQFIDINTVEWSDKGTIPLQMVKRTERVEQILKETQKYLGEKYVRPLYGEYHMDYCDLVNGMDDNVYEWHNDYEENKVNLGILLYFSDTDEDIGSGIGFRDPISKVEHAFFYPKAGDVCILNHTTKFEHRVTKQNIPLPRIVASFHYYVNGIN